MKTLYMMVTSWCPHCKNAKAWIEELQKEKAEYQKIDLQIVDEETDPRAESLAFDYYYVPTFFLGKEKLHEGVTKRELVEDALQQALKS